MQGKPNWPVNKEPVSAGVGGTWSKINTESIELFGKSTTDMMKMCSDFVVKNGKSNNKFERQKAYLDLILSLQGWQ